MTSIGLIKEAILDLKDRTGSSTIAINKWIEENKKVRSILAVECFGSVRLNFPILIRLVSAICRPILGLLDLFLLSLFHYHHTYLSCRLLYRVSLIL